MGNVIRTDWISYNELKAKLIETKLSDGSAVYMIELTYDGDFMAALDCPDFENADALMDALVKHTGGSNGG